MDLFPFPCIRKGQREFLLDVRKVLELGGILFAHAPTGIGKTAAVLAPSLEYAFEHDKVVFFLTSKQSQHRIGIETLRMIKSLGVEFSAVDIISKQDMCPRPISKEHYAIFNEMCILDQKTKRCSYYRRNDPEVIEAIQKRILHVEELSEFCRRKGICPHKTALDAAEKANVIVCDYNYLFSDISETILEKIGIELEDIILIVDEAHNLPDRIRSILSGELTINMLKEATKEAKSIDGMLHRHLREITEFFNKIDAETENMEKNIDKEFFMDGIERILRGSINPMGYWEFVKKLKEVSAEDGRGAMMGVAEFLEGWATNFDCSRIFSRRIVPSLSFKLLDPSILSGEIITEVHACIMMSGTLYPTEMYADILGANKEKTMLRTYESPFPRENRLIIVTDGITTRYVERSEEMYEKIAEKICSIVSVVEGGTAVFFPSYSLLRSITDYFSPEIMAKTLIEERNMDKTEKNRLYDELKENGGILCGVQAGSLSEGMDYEGNILKAVIIVGLPLSPPTLEVKNVESYYTKKFGRNKGKLYGYVYPAISKVLQAAGRGIRSENDVGVIILMDYRFKYPVYRKCLPPDYELKITSKPEVLCKRFFEEIRRKKKNFGGIKTIGDSNKPTEIAFAIFELLKELGFPPGRTILANILIGSRSKQILNQNLQESRYHGILKNYTKDEVIGIIDQLIEEGYLEKRQRSRLYLTERAERVLEKKERVEDRRPKMEKRLKWI
ncbi:MAG: helicase C-terminal domain-containing protein [Candidatus Syntropharchaeia archaeon]